MVCDVAGGLEAESLADFDVFVALAEDVRWVDGWMIAFDPQRAFLAEWGAY